MINKLGEAGIYTLVDAHQDVFARSICGEGVPDFWAKAIEGHPMLMQIITEKDKPIIQHVTEVRAEKTEEPSPMLTIEMDFSENEYFSNSTLKFITREQKDGGRTEEVIG